MQQLGICQIIRGKFLKIIKNVWTATSLSDNTDKLTFLPVSWDVVWTMFHCVNILATIFDKRVISENSLHCSTSFSRTGGVSIQIPCDHAGGGSHLRFCAKRNYGVLLRGGPMVQFFSKTNYRAYYIHYFGSRMVKNFSETYYRTYYKH